MGNGTDEGRTPVPGSETLASIEARLAALEDREAIRRLIASYGPLADLGDAQAAAALWTEDGTYDIGTHGAHRGHRGIAALLESDEHRQLIAGGAAHILSAPLIDLDGDRATARTYSCVLRKNGNVWVAHRVAANHWQLARTQAGWRVTGRVNRLLDGSAEARALIGNRI